MNQDVVQKNLLLVMVNYSDSVRQIKNNLIKGVLDSEANIKCQHLCPLDVKVEDVLKADAIILSATENFAYMCGELKTFFDRIYYPCLEKKQGLPYALIVKAGNDGTNTVFHIEKIISGLRWKKVQDCTLIVGPPKKQDLKHLYEMGQGLAIALEQGII